MIFTSLCLAQPARAETKYTPQVVPKCAVLEFSSGEKRCTYTLEEVKALYKIDAEFLRIKKMLLLQSQKILLQGRIIEWQQEQLRLSAKNTALLNRRMNSLTNLYTETDKKLQLELARPKWGHYIAWGLTSAVTALLVGYIAADQIDK